MTKAFAKNLMLFMIAALMIISFWLGFRLNALNEDITLLKAELSARNSEVAALKADIGGLKNRLAIADSEITRLNNKINELNGSYQRTLTEKKALENNLQVLGKDYSALKKETFELLQDVELYQEEIQKSLEWYGKNSVLGATKEESNVKKHIEASCVLVEDVCRIKLGCFYLINKRKLGLSYQYDETVYGKDDKLSSITEFLENRGGDCEDYSLFYKAEYNYALAQCKGKEVILEGWKRPEKGDSELTYWLDFQRTWYLESVTRIDIMDFIYPNIICGNLYDLNAGNISGHCLIAFTDARIESIGDLSFLDGAYMIEPQDGSFRGRINKDGVYLLDKAIFYDDSKTSWIYSVITDSDYYLFSENKMEWQSYSSFNKLLREKSEHLRG